MVFAVWQDVRALRRLPSSPSGCSALGAQMRDVLGLVLKHALLLVTIGGVIGLLGTYAAKNVLKSLLFEVAPTDFTVFAAVPVVLFFVALWLVWCPREERQRSIRWLRCDTNSLHLNHE